jgi:hypothetical protein
MKPMYFLVALFFVVVSMVALPAASAGNSGPSANGDFEFVLDDGAVRNVQFNVRIHKNGSAQGEMTFSDPVGTSEGTPVSVKAKFDCLVINTNKAVMSGVIAEATNSELVGNRVLLVVEDNGEGIGAASTDKLTWGVYLRPNRNWIPSDFEVPGDTGFLLDWIATDFERTDDVGIPARPSEVVGCQSFPLSSYALTNVNHGQGNIQVRP